MRRSVSRPRWGLGLLAAVLLCLGLTTSAQMAGIVRGTVVDTAGKRVEGANVTFAFEGGLTRTYQTSTDAQGFYSQVGLSPGPYTITATKEGIGSKATQVTLRPGARMTVNIDLTPVPVAAANASPVAKAFQAAVAASNDGRHDEAITGFEEALRADPTCFDCQYNLGLVHTKVKRYDKAEAAFRKAREMKPNAPEPLEGLAAVYNATRRFDEAAQASQAAVDLRGAGTAGAGGNAGSVFDQGLVLWNAGKIDEALAKFRDTLRLDPSHGEVHYWFGMGHLNQGRMPDAAQELEIYLAREPAGRFAQEARTLLPQIKKPPER